MAEIAHLPLSPSRAGQTVQTPARALIWRRVLIWSSIATMIGAVVLIVRL